MRGGLSDEPAPIAEPAERACLEAKRMRLSDEVVNPNPVVGNPNEPPVAPQMDVIPDPSLANPGGRAVDRVSVFRFRP